MTLGDELKAMLQEARRYVATAEALRARKDYDSAVSRLYYAMFYCAEALLLARGPSFSSHRPVVSAFAQHFVKPGLLPKEVHEWLRTALEKRQVGDYEFVTSWDETDIAEMRTRAEQFLAKAEELLKSGGSS